VGQENTQVRDKDIIAPHKKAIGSTESLLARRENALVQAEPVLVRRKDAPGSTEEVLVRQEKVWCGPSRFW
jgi:hypothetical protein